MIGSTTYNGHGILIQRQFAEAYMLVNENNYQWQKVSAINSTSIVSAKKLAISAVGRTCKPHIVHYRGPYKLVCSNILYTFSKNNSINFVLFSSKLKPLFLDYAAQVI